MKSIIKLVAVLFIACLLVVTNPSSSSHSAEIASQFRSENKVLGLIPGITNLADSATDYHDCVFFSVKMYRDEIVSFGAFNRVFVRSLDIDI